MLGFFPVGEFPIGILPLGGWSYTGATTDTHDGDLGTPRDYAYWHRLREREEEARRRREAIEAEISEEVAEAVEEIEPAAAATQRPYQAPDLSHLAAARAEIAALVVEAETLAREQLAAAEKIAKRRRDEETILLLM